MKLSHLLLLTLAVGTARAHGPSASGHATRVDAPEAKRESRVDAFDTTLRAYEAIRTSLVRDRLAGVKGSAAQIAKGAGDLAKAYEPATARTPGRSSEEMVPILTAVSSAAREVAAAADIESARKAFSSLSDAMIRWRSVATGTKPVVVYCSMAERWWIQPDERIGNPYYGQSMATCGQVIDR